MGDDADRTTEDQEVEGASQQIGGGSKSGSPSKRSEVSSESQLSSLTESTENHERVPNHGVDEDSEPEHASEKNGRVTKETSNEEADPADKTASDVPSSPAKEGNAESSTATSPPARTLNADSTPATTSKKPKSKMVGGLMLASTKTMKPFHSPIINRQTGNASASSSKSTAPAKSTDTPTRPSSSTSTSKATPRPLVTPFRSTASKSSANKALNKPFVSPVVRASAASTSTSSTTDSSDIPMSSFQLNSALPVLERRLANLKNAKRYLKAMDQDLQTSDNTEHIFALSLKWLKAGREASEMLWEATKDSYGNEEGAQANDSGYGNGQFGGGSKGSSWGWAATDEVKNMTDATTKELEDMSDRDREEAIRHIEDEDARDPLPDSPQEILSRSSSRSSSSTNLKRKSSNSSRTSNESQGRPKKLARLEEDIQEIEEDSRTEEEVEQESMEMDPELLDNPKDRGMAKMLLQCGIDLKTFGWDAGKEEWDTKNEQDD